LSQPTQLTSIRLADFRCFERLTFEPDPGTNFIIGANAQGKTSILEAVCAATRLQSPRTNSLAECVRVGQTGFGLTAHVADTTLQFRYEPPKRTLRLDAVDQLRPAAYLQTARIAWFSNDDLDIVRGSATRRRRALDFLCSQLDPGYLRALRRFDRALRSRNALLREHRPRPEIDAFDPDLIENGDLVSATRADLSTALAPLIATAVHDIGGASETVTTRYLPGADAPLATALPASRDRETRLRQTVVGPHRDDLAFLFDDLDASKYASEGQQRTLAIALKLAQTRLLIARTDRIPILLIDDVFGELDPTRRANLLAHLPPDSQRLITTTHLGWLDPTTPGSIHRIEHQSLVSDQTTTPSLQNPA
jgi:DNA replication and repair protein RecF